VKWWERVKTRNGGVGRKEGVETWMKNNKKMKEKGPDGA
jgi:hypothetical protein